MNLRVSTRGPHDDPNDARGAGRVRATHEQSAGKLLQATDIDVPGPGTWELRVTVRRELCEGVITTCLEAAPTKSESDPARR